MKVYIDKASMKLLGVEKERPFYVGDTSAVLKIYFNESLANTSVTLSFLLPNERKPRSGLVPDSVETDSTEIYGSSSWYCCTWNLSAKSGILTTAGTLQMTVSVIAANVNKQLNFVNNVVKAANYSSDEENIFVIGENPANVIMDAVQNIAALQNADNTEAANRAAADNSLQNQINNLNTAKVNKTDIADNLTTNDAAKVLSAKQGYLLENEIAGLRNAGLHKTDIVNGLNSTETEKVLSAAMGKQLNDTKVNKGDVKNDLTSTDTQKPLSAYQGKLLKDMIDSINLILQSNDVDLDTIQEIVNYIKDNEADITALTSGKVNVSDIINNLTSNVSNKPLSAAQGYILKGLVDDLTTALGTAQTKLDTIQTGATKTETSSTNGCIRINGTEVQIYTLPKPTSVALGGVKIGSHILIAADGTIYIDNASSLADGTMSKEDKALLDAITSYSLTIGTGDDAVTYTTIPTIIAAIYSYLDTLNDEVAGLEGSDTSFTERITTIETNLTALQTAWNTFMAGTNADNITDTLLSVQQNIVELQNAILIPAVTKTDCIMEIPTGSKYATIKKVGSIQWRIKQILDNTSMAGASSTIDGVQIGVQNSSPYNVVLHGTAEADIEATISPYCLFQKGHRYYISGLLEKSGVSYKIGNDSNTYTSNFVYTETAEANNNSLQIEIANGTVLNYANDKFTPSIFDLSIMGITATTNAEIEKAIEMTGCSLTGYNTFSNQTTWSDSTPSVVKSYDENGNLVESISINVDSGTMTMQGINLNCFNYMDLENQKVVTKVAQTTLSYDWEYQADGYWLSSAIVDKVYVNAKALTSLDSIPNIASSNYVAASPNDVINGNIINSISTDLEGEHFIVYNGSSETSPSDGFVLFEKATPTETTNTTLEEKQIEVVNNGVIEALNMNLLPCTPIEIKFDLGLIDIVETNTKNDKKQQEQINSLISRLSGYELLETYVDYLYDILSLTGASGTLTTTQYNKIHQYAKINWRADSSSSYMELNYAKVDTTTVGSVVLRTYTFRGTIGTLLSQEGETNVILTINSDKSWTVLVEKPSMTKPLYNLQAYDSYSNGVVTRQTWEVDASQLTWGYSSTYGNWYSLESLSGAIIPRSDDDIVTNGFIASNYSNYGTANQVRTHNADYGLNYNGQIMIYNGSSTEQPKGLFQYKLATSYTENVIEDTPLLALDQAGCNWVRDEYVKGLNLFDRDSNVKTTNMTFNATQYISWSDRTLCIIKLKPNTTYTYNSTSNEIKMVLSNSDSLESYSFLSSSYYSGEGSKTFTTDNTYLYFVMSFVTSSEANVGFMLNEGSHPYPYSEYCGEIVHKVDIEPVLLWENSSPNSAFSGGINAITLNQSISNFKYLVIEYAPKIGLNLMSEIRKFRVSTNIAFTLFYYKDWYRDFTLTSSGITVGQATDNSSNNNNDWLVPVRIYGTNVL